MKASPILFLLPTLATGASFDPPVRLTAGGQPISVSAPGYAFPSVADVDGDGSPDLVVGQFARGALMFYKNTAPAGETPILSEGEWLTTDGKPATVPGVW